MNETDRENLVPNPAVELQNQFLSQTIDHRALLDGLFALDQQDEERTAAGDNLAVLDNIGVWNRFDKHEDLQLRDDYYNMVSLEHLHVGQSIEGEEPETAAKHYDSALKAARSMNQEDWGKDWGDYIETVCALQSGDTVKATELYNLMPDTNPNKEVIAKKLGI